MPLYRNRCLSQSLPTPARDLLDFTLYRRVFDLSGLGQMRARQDIARPIRHRTLGYSLDGFKNGLLYA
jgi:hypothetical protein